MSDIEIFKEMIIKTATVPLEDHHTKKKVILSESSPPNYSVTIHGMPDDDQTIVIKADVFSAPKNIFANSKHECKRSDFVILADTYKGKFIICIELKGGKGGSKEEIIQQLKGTRCLVNYCREIGQSFWQSQNLLKDYEYRFVCITKISMSKKKTRPSKKSEPIHDHPNHMLKITDIKGLQFNHLVGKR